MKRIRFVPSLVPLIMNGSKTITWRLWDDKNLSKGDTVEFLETGKDKPFAMAEITKAAKKLMSELKDEEKDGHEKFKNDREMYKTYTKYYGKKVGPKTLVKVIWFKLI